MNVEERIAYLTSMSETLQTQLRELNLLHEQIHAAQTAVSRNSYIPKLRPARNR
jgi:hypothetical protein